MCLEVWFCALCALVVFEVFLCTLLASVELEVGFGACFALVLV